MSEAFDHQDLHHWVDRLTPEQVRRLRLVIEEDDALPEVAEEREEDEEAVPQGLLDLIGMVESGRTDMAEKHEEYLRERFRRRDAHSA